MTTAEVVLATIVGLVLWGGLAWFVIAPLVFGFKPFTSPSQAARGERRLGS